MACAKGKMQTAFANEKKCAEIVCITEKSRSNNEAQEKANIITEVKIIITLAAKFAYEPYILL